MTTTNFKTYLNNFYVSKSEQVERPVTHTRIPDKLLNISGGTYHIPDDKLEEFYARYEEHVLVNGNREYLTEKQLDCGAICVDFDFRYEVTVTERQHTDEHINALTILYTDALKEIYKMENEIVFPIYFFEKPNVVVVEDKKLTKDGIHVIIGIMANRNEQIYLRELVLNKIKNNYFEKDEMLPLTNDWENVIDEGIITGKSNWQLYGSRKSPNYEPYKLIYAFNCNLNKEMGEFEMKPHDISTVEFKKLTARYDQHPKFDLKQNINFETKKKQMNTQPELNHPLSNQNEEIIDDLKRCADVVPVENINNRDTWLKLMYALRDFKKVAIHMSERTTRADLKPFDEEYYEKIMNDDTGGNTIDTFFYYARLGNAGLANEIKEKWFKKNKDLERRDFANATTHYEKADLIMQTIGDNFVYVEKELFVFDDNTQRWRLDEDKEFAKLLIKKELYKMGTSHLDELNNKLATQTKQDDANKALGLISSCATLMKANQCVKEISNVCTAVVQNLSARNDKTEFDKNPYLFAFENLVYDFKTGIFRPHKKEDFIIMTCGYDYHEPTFEQTKKITEVIERIFVDEEVRRHYISVLRNGCIGICPEKFIIANGNGRNGKGMLNDMFRDTIGEYGYKGSAATLTEKTKEGANPAVANMHKKRFLSFQEPDVKQQLNVATIKEISGGGELNARQLYSKKTKTVLHGVVVLETNEKPDLNGSDADSTALKDRICDVPFDSTFVNKPEEVDEELKMFLKDPELKEAEFVEGHRCALFDYIRTYKGVETIYVPDIIAERSAEYLRGNDMIFTFMLENYEKVTDDTEVVQLKDAYELFKSSNYFINLDKKEKRSLNQSNFVEKVSRHSYFKKDFREKLQTKIIKEKYGKALIRTCLVNWKEKYEEVEEEED